MNRKRRLQLVTIVSVAVFIITSLIMTSIHRSSRGEETEKYAELTSIYLWTYDKAAVNKYFETISFSGGISSLKITDSSGETFVELESPPKKTLLSRLHGHETLTKQVFYGGQAIGSIEINFHHNLPLQVAAILAVVILLAQIFFFVGEALNSRRENAELQMKIIQADKLATIGTMAASIAHELKNPLSAILGYAELTRDAIVADKIVKEELIGNLDIIISSADRMKEISQHTRTFSRDSSAEAMTPMDINEVATNSLFFISKPLRNSCITLETRLAKDLPLVPMNQIQIESVIINLLSNAKDELDSLPKEHLKKITIETRLACIKGEDCITLSVADTGHGVTDEVKRHIFDPFFTTKKNGTGTGLGLSISMSIAQKHHGHLLIESTPGEGTMFTLVLPMTHPGKEKTT